MCPPWFFLAGLVLCLERWESSCGSCPAQTPGFPFLEVRWDGREQGGAELGTCASPPLIKPGQDKGGSPGTAAPSHPEAAWEASGQC